MSATIDTRRWEATHGRKPRGLHGNFIFDVALTDGRGAWTSERVCVWATTLREAARKARTHAQRSVPGARAHTVTLEP